MTTKVLTTSIVRDTPYFDAIWPLTEPIFQAYADKWEMDFRPHIVQDWDPDLTYFNTSPAPHGTGVVYAGIPGRRQMLDDYQYVTFIDSDAVIMSDRYDITRTVTDNCPIAAGGAFNGAVVVMRSHPWSKEFLDLVWEMRQEWRLEQWCEQGAMMTLCGWDGHYPGDNTAPAWRGETEWTHRWSNSGFDRWNASPFHPQEVRPLIAHPGGIQPFSRRLELVKEAISGSWKSVWPDWDNLEDF